MMQLAKENLGYKPVALENVSINNKGTSFIGTEIFPAVLHNLLDEAQEKGYSHIVSWQPHGRSFVVHKRKEFSQFVMPAFYRMSKFASFQRQLNLYDFKRIIAGPDKGGYYNEMFVRGQKGLCKHMLRQPLKGTLIRKPASVSEPDFYQYEVARSARDKLFFGYQGSSMNERLRQSNTPGTQCMPAPSMFMRTVTADTEFSNMPSCIMDVEEERQPVTMAMGDFRGIDSQKSLMATMAGLREFYSSHKPTDFKNLKRCISCIDDEHAFPGPGRIWKDTKHQISDPTLEQRGYSMDNKQSIVSMMRPSPFTMCGETKRLSKYHWDNKLANDESSLQSNQCYRDIGVLESSPHVFRGESKVGLHDTAASHYGTDSELDEGCQIVWMGQT